MFLAFSFNILHQLDLAAVNLHAKLSGKGLIISTWFVAVVTSTALNARLTALLTVEKVKKNY